MTDAIDSTPADEQPSVDLTGLTSAAKARPGLLGRRGSRMVIDASDITKVTDSHRNLVLFNLREVFTRPSVAIGFGVPNTYLIFPDADGTGWDKLNAFMFYRHASYVARTKDRVQAGVLFELVGLHPDVAARIDAFARARAGRRSPSCAYEVAHTLADAGFTSPGGSLRTIVRPSELAWLLWEYGLHHNGQEVTLRIITTTDTPNEHFQAVWRKEATAPARLVTKLIDRGRAVTAPVVPAVEREPAVTPDTSGVLTTLGITRPSAAGAWLGIAFGEQPIYTVFLDNDRTRTVTDGVLTGPALSSALAAYPGKLDAVTKAKRHLLFSKPVVRALRSMLAAEVETYPSVPAGIVPPMLRLSTRERADAFVYNYVLTGTEMRVKRLESRTKRESERLQWVLSKHVLLAGYSPDVRLAGELWTYQREDGQQVLVVNANSGTYKPGPERIRPAADLVSAIFGVPVEIADLP